MVNLPNTKIIIINKNTFEAWKEGKKEINCFNSCGNETFLEEDFSDCEKVCKNLVKAPKSIEYPDSEYLRKRLDTVNCSEIRKDLLFVIHKYRLAKRRRGNRPDRDDSYVSFLWYYLGLSAYGIPRKHVRKEYVDQEEWEFMKDADEYAIVKQNPYMRVEYDGELVKITVWG